MVEEKVVTIALAAVGVAVFNFDAYDPPLNLAEIFPVKSSYKADETVYVQYCVKNVGTAAGGATVTVKDLDTGAVVATYTIPALDPGYRWRTSGGGANVGRMPNKDWRLSFKVTP